MPRSRARALPPPALLALLAAAGCAVAPEARPIQESVVSPDAPVFDPRLRGADPQELDLAAFWEVGAGTKQRAAGDSPAPVPIHNRTVADLATRVRPGVVNLYTRQVQRRDVVFGISPNDLLPVRLPIVSAVIDFIPFQVPIPFRTEGVSLGSGFVVNRHGFILTNAHVVHNATDIRVVFPDQRGEFPARIVGSDRLTDTALIRIDTRTPLTPLPLGDSDALAVGEMVIAVGNPLGLNHTVTSGFVSAVERVMPDDSAYLDFLQTDSAINPGSSGGPLLDLYGEVVGINTALASEAQLIGFAIPINIVKAVMPLLVTGQTERGWLGVLLAAPRIGELGEAIPDVEGAVVEEVDPAGPAAAAGLRPGDRIVALDGQPVPDVHALRRRWLALLPGDEIELAVARGPERITAPVRLATAPNRD
jgi:serine protease Do